MPELKPLFSLDGFSMLGLLGHQLVKKGRESQPKMARNNTKNNHCYRFEQQTRRQNDGGSIGNQLTGEVADVVMAWWAGEFEMLAPVI